MPVLDRREAAVYVTIEDKSYLEPSLEIGRVVYSVILCDHGPHNRLVEVNLTKFRKLFGKPDIRRTSQSFYVMDKALQYTGKGLVCRVVPEDATLANDVIEFDSTATALVDSAYTFTNGSKVVTSTDISGLSVGDWIANSADTIDEVAQVVAITGDTAPYTITLDREYSGSSGNDVGANKYAPYKVSSQIGVITDMAFDTNVTDVVYYIYANGAGEWYNNIVIKGVRNTSMEKQYVDDNGDVLYKYLFMDIGVYQVDDNGNYILLEGPWTVSLIPRLSTGEAVRDIASGEYLYIENVINKRSDIVRIKAALGVEDLISHVNAEDKRLQVMLLFSDGTPLGTSNIAGTGINLENGTNGTGMYDISGNLVPSPQLFGLVKQAYAGTLTSVDGSVEQLREVVYPWYEPDYIIVGGFDADTEDGGRQLSEYREDCMTLADTGGIKYSPEEDLDARLNDVPWNTWTAMLYTQYRKFKDEYTGIDITMTPVYHAIERHLFVDGAYFIAEPVAGIEKGAIQQKIELVYRANHVVRGDFKEHELNATIVEPDGKYFCNQYTAWKRLSVLKQAHVAKFVMYLRKMIPPLLKDILHRKATQFWINEAKFRVETFLSHFLENPAIERYSILKSFNVNVEFDDISSELNIIVDITPIRSIEKINVYIIVH
jgi:hypothetical protein